MNIRTTSRYRPKVRSRCGAAATPLALKLFISDRMPRNIHLHQYGTKENAERALSRHTV